MSNKKQSSLDVLISGLLEYIHEAHHLEVLELYEQAKAMHEDEIKIAHGSGRLDRHNDFSRTPEQYYNETFGELTNNKTEVDLREMVNVWIQNHGDIGLDTSEQEIIDFYHKIQGGNNEQE